MSRSFDCLLRSSTNFKTVRIILGLTVVIGKNKPTILYNPLKDYKYIILLMIWAFACSGSMEQLDFPTEPTIPPDTIDFIALGDSYTVGEGVSQAESWPYQLGRELRFNGYEVAQTYVIANTGWNTKSLLNAIAETDLSEVRDDRMVSLLIGVNNQYQDSPFETFKAEFDLLLEEAIRLAGGPENVFVVSIPDYSVTSFGTNNSNEISQEIDVYNYYMLNRTDDFEIPFLDVTRISRELGNTEQAISPDGLHPSGFQYQRWVEVMLPTVLWIVSK